MGTLEDVGDIVENRTLRLGSEATDFRLAEHSGESQKILSRKVTGSTGRRVKDKLHK